MLVGGLTIYLVQRLKRSTVQVKGTGKPADHIDAQIPIPGTAGESIANINDEGPSDRTKILVHDIHEQDLKDEQDSGKEQGSDTKQESRDEQESTREQASGDDQDSDPKYDSKDEQETRNEQVSGDGQVSIDWKIAGDKQDTGEK